MKGDATKWQGTQLALTDPAHEALEQDAIRRLSEIRVSLSTILVNLRKSRDWAECSIELHVQAMRLSSLEREMVALGRLRYSLTQANRGAIPPVRKS